MFESLIKGTLVQNIHNTERFNKANILPSGRIAAIEPGTLMSELPGRILGQPEYVKSTEGSVESFVHKKPLQIKK